MESILGPSTLTVGYLAGSGALGANNPQEKAGLFDGDYAALAQLNFNLGDRIGLGVTYVHGYHNRNSAIFDLGGSVGSGTTPNVADPNFVRGPNPPTDNIGRGMVGSFNANNPGVFSSFNGGAPRLTPIVTNSYGIEAAIRLTNNISISGFGAYTQAILLGLGRGDIWTFGAGIALSDFGTPGSVLGFFAGAAPTLRGLTPGVRPTVVDARNFEYVWHYELFYKYKLNDNISITPGVIWLPVTNNDSSDYNSALIGTLRTTFTF